MAHTHGAIAAGNPKTVEAGIEIFQQGGNVFDAVVAAVLAACVAEPTLTSLAGGGFLLAHTNENQNILFDFFTQTPGQKKPASEIDFYPVDVNFGTVTQEFHVGLGSIAVPGVAKGLFQVHQKLGRLPLKIVAEPAIRFAKEGITLDEFQAYCFKILGPIWVANEESRRVCAVNNALPQMGTTLKMSALGESIAYLAEHGIQEFYEGEIARKLINDCDTKGGYLTLDDLKNYQVIERTPLEINYRGNTFLTNPPPSSGGALIAFSLALLSQLDLSKIEFGSTHHLQILAEVMRQTNRARKDGYDANLYQPNIAEQFLSADHLSSYQTVLNKWGSTTHISAIDSEGNAASVTTSNGEGAAYMIPGTGIMMNNMLGEADLHPNGFHQWQDNVRISSMMSPTIVLKNNQPEIVLGSGGSNRIRTAILQVISNIIDFNMPVEEAVNSPRVHWENNVFNVEPGFSKLEIDRTQFPFNDDLVLWEQQNMFFGGVHTVSQNEAGLIAGAGDRRRNGSVLTT